MIHQEHNHSWNGSVMYLFVFVCLCVSVCDVRLYVCSGGVISLSISLFFLPTVCLHLIITHVKNKPQHMYV